MQSRFEFLEDQFPKLAEYGRKAEQAFDHDNNICLLYLGRLAEEITKLLCFSNKLPDNSTIENLLQHGVIDRDIHLKIAALMEIKDEITDSNYASEMACRRLFDTAVELCKWFVREQTESRFDFLGDLFPPNSPVPPLGELAEFGREAESNLYANTRYCLICLGDIGEAAADFLITRNNLHSHGNDQMSRIDTLRYKDIIDRNTSDTLHDLRKARNDAIHSRFASEEDGRILLDKALKVCEWIFRETISRGDIIKGRIASILEDSINVKIGGLTGTVSREEIPIDDHENISDHCTEGEKHMFKVIDTDNDAIALSIKQVNSDPWITSARKYAKYEIGQIVTAEVKRLTETFGTLVVLNHELEACIPYSELGSDKLRLGQIVKAKVKWFNPKHYPYMILSVKDTGQPAIVEEIEISDTDFVSMCGKSPADEIAQALAYGANPNAKDHNGMTALMKAAQSNPDSEVIGVLVKAGAYLEARYPKSGNTALLYAAKSNTPEVVKALIEAGAKITAKNNYGDKAHKFALRNPKLKDSDILTLLKPIDTKENINARFIKACEAESIEDIFMLLSEGANVNTSTREKITPLMITCEKNNPDAVNILLENRAKVNIINKDGKTALMTASQYGTSEIIAALLDHKADVKARDKLGNTSLHIASRYNTSESVTVLLDAGSDINAMNDKGFTPLDFALKNAGLDGTEAIIRLGINARLLEQCKSGDTQTIADLINKGADVNARNEYGLTPLIIACDNNNPEAVSLLLEHGADVNAQDDSGRTPLMIAVQSSDGDIVSLLISRGSDINARDEGGNTALMISAEYRTADIAEELLTAGADIDAVNADGMQAIDFAVHNENLEETDTLEKLRWTEIFTAEHIEQQKQFLNTCRYGTPEDISTALNYRVEVNIMNSKKLTALMYAARFNTPEAVSILLDAGADIALKTDKGYTALDYARKNENLNDSDVLERLAHN